MIITKSTEKLYDMLEKKEYDCYKIKCSSKELKTLQGAIQTLANNMKSMESHFTKEDFEYMNYLVKCFNKVGLK